MQLAEAHQQGLPGLLELGSFHGARQVDHEDRFARQANGGQRVGRWRDHHQQHIALAVSFLDERRDARRLAGFRRPFEDEVAVGRSQLVGHFG